MEIKRLYLDEYENPPFVDSKEFTFTWSYICDSRADYWSLLEGDTELGRAILQDYETSDNFIGLSEGIPAKNLLLFAIRETCRNQGLGKFFIRQLETEYSNTPLVVFSEADKFYETLKWVNYKYKKDEENIHNRKFFASRRIES